MYIGLILPIFDRSGKVPFLMYLLNNTDRSGLIILEVRLMTRIVMSLAFPFLSSLMIFSISFGIQSFRNILEVLCFGK